jgi:hypothetical protein
MTDKANTIEEFFPAGHQEETFIWFANAATRIAEAATKNLGPASGRAKVVVDRRTLYKVVTSALYDIVRYKHFHFSGDHTKKSDAVKRAAFFTKWIIRFKPITLLTEDEDLSDDVIDTWLLTLNEHLAVQWACQCIAKDHALRLVSLNAKFRSELIYELNYRDLNADGLISIFQMISDTIKSNMSSPHFETAK